MSEFFRCTIEKEEYQRPLIRIAETDEGLIAHTTIGGIKYVSIAVPMADFGIETAADFAEMHRLWPPVFFVHCDKAILRYEMPLRQPFFIMWQSPQKSDSSLILDTFASINELLAMASRSGSDRMIRPSPCDRG